MTSALLFMSMCLAPNRIDVVGSYRADFSRAPQSSRSVLQGFFQGPLAISPNGKFQFCGIEQGGFWRREGGRVVLVYSGFFRASFPVPDAVLKRSWPTNDFEGLVAAIHKDGTIWFKGLGRAMGPVVFRKVPRRTTVQLLAASIQEEDNAKSEEAYIALMDDAANRQGDLYTLIASPKTPHELRGWACSFLPVPCDQDESARFVRILRNLDTTGLNPDQARYVRRSLARHVERHPTPEGVDAIIELVKADRLDKFLAARVIGAAKSVKYAPLLAEWCRTETRSRRSLLEGLAKTGAPEALPILRTASSDADPNVRFAAHSGLIIASPDESERTASIHALAGLWDKMSYPVVTILPAWGASKSKAALPYVVNIFENSTDPMDRVLAAKELGKLGFPEAVFSLMEAKLGKARPGWTKPKNEQEAFQKLGDILGDMVADAPVRKAAVEALWIFDQRTQAKRQ